MLDEHPEYRRDTLAMFEAARRNRPDVVEFLTDLGISIEVENEHGGRPLHEAAYAGALDVASLLLARGAEVDPRERVHGNTPLGHAVYGKQQRIIELLAPVSRDIWELTWCGALERLGELIAAEPALAKTRGSGGDTPLMWLPDDDARALAMAQLYLEHGADPAARNEKGETAALIARRRGLDEVADLLEAPPGSARLAVFEQRRTDREDP